MSDRYEHAKLLGLSRETHDWFMESYGGDHVRRMDEEIAAGDIKAARITRTALWRWALRCIAAGTPHCGGVHAVPGVPEASLDRVWAAWAEAMEVALGEAQKRLKLAADETDEP